MTLRLIGAGLGRTGTLSAKLALERLGFGPCYHMVEVFKNPAHIPIWERANDGHAVDWEALFVGYASTVDWPACKFWGDLIKAYPDAKVLLTVRDPEAWYESAAKTIFQIDERVATSEVGRLQIPMARKVVHGTFPKGLGDKAHCIEIYRRHNEDVQRALGSRVLTYDVADGWVPLCAFLGVAVPDEPFPKTNSAEEFRTRTGLDKLAPRARP
jgi:hypothetical protein